MLATDEHTGTTLGGRRRRSWAGLDVVGVGLVFAGTALTLTVVGSVIGVPLVIFGAGLLFEPKRAGR